MRYILFPFLLLAALLTGCSTVSRRIEEKSSYFNTLDAQTQERLRRSAIKVGDTQDMVYIAFGRPDRVYEKQSGKRSETVWGYSTYRDEFAGTHFMGYQRNVFFDPRTGRRFVAYDPVYATAYRERREEYLRVVFENGRVTSLEQMRD